MNIRPSAAIRQNYNEIADHVCRKPQGRIKIPDERGRPRGCDRIRGSV